MLIISYLRFLFYMSCTTFAQLDFFSIPGAVLLPGCTSPNRDVRLIGSRGVMWTDEAYNRS